MFNKNKKKISIAKVLIMIVGLIVILSLAGCLELSTDETQIKQIAKNIEKAIKNKSADLFMENISYNYSDDDGGTYDNHINNLPENIISQMELADSLASSVYDNLRVVADVAISNLTVVEEQYASGKMKIKYSLKICNIFGCVPIYWIVGAEESRNFDIDFIKEDDDWKIILLMET